MPQIQQTLQAVAQIDTSNQPFAFTVENDKIVGFWKVTDSRWFALTSVTDIERNYRIDVSFDEKKGTYKTEEADAGVESKFGVNVVKGTIGGSTELNTFKGKMSNKSFRIGIGGEKDGSNGVGLNTIQFDTAQIKKPLFEFLESQGWKKAGFLSGIFG
jgi:hypothetical protein